MRVLKLELWFILLTLLYLPAVCFSASTEEVENRYISAEPNIYMYGGLGMVFPFSESMFTPVYYGSSAAGAIGMEISDLTRIGRLRLSIGGETALHEFFFAINRPIQGYVTGTIMRAVTDQPSVLMEVRLGFGFGQFLNVVPGTGEIGTYKGIFVPVEGALRLNPHLKLSGQIRAYRVFGMASADGEQLYMNILVTLGYFLF